MSDEPQPFELEDESGPPRRRDGRTDPPPPAPAPGGDGGEFRVEEDKGVEEIEVEHRAPGGPALERLSGRIDPRGGEEEEGVDERTVAERLGTAVDVVAGARPPPPGWPGEAFAYPLRAPGPGGVVAGAVLWGLLDLATRANLFLGLVLKVLALPLFLRWQLHEAAMTAGGRDRPSGWAAAMDLSREQLKGIGRLLVAAVVLLLPAFVAFRLERPVLGLVLVAVGLLVLSAGALGQAVGEGRLLWPWHALGWIGRRPLGLLAATAGWWAAGLVEWAVGGLADAAAAVAIPLFGVLRLAFLYLWLVSARALGVVGRAWSPWQEEDAPVSDARGG